MQTNGSINLILVVVTNNKNNTNNSWIDDNNTLTLCQYECKLRMYKYKHQLLLNVFTFRESIDMKQESNSVYLCEEGLKLLISQSKIENLNKVLTHL